MCNNNNKNCPVPVDLELDDPFGKTSKRMDGSGSARRNIKHGSG